MEWNIASLLILSLFFLFSCGYFFRLSMALMTKQQQEEINRLAEKQKQESTDIVKDNNDIKE
jgi:hypothetical protein